MSSFSTLPADAEAFGCHVNAIDTEQLFQKYQDAGFLYEEKRRKLAPHLDRVRENWERALSLGQSLLWFVTFDDPQRAVWASVGSWRTTLRGWNSQHVVSIGGPVGSRGVPSAHAVDPWIIRRPMVGQRCFGGQTQTGHSPAPHLGNRGSRHRVFL